jgi:ATP-dependent DNA helicase RecG
MDCIRRGYLEDYLRDSDSSLVSEMNARSAEDLLLSMEVANNTDAGIMLRNIGVLMFAERPDKFIPCTQIDLVHFHTPDAEGSDEFTEKTFYGPIQKQVRDALHYIDTTIITKKVVKIEGQAESESYYNYPYNALEEVLVNSVFHKSYRDPEPIEIRIYVDCIKILNYPGPELWIDMEKFAKGMIISRKYRNRRIGEFFQEIDLSEKKSTGITKILRVLERNGSPPPEFETDPGRHYMIATIRIRDGFEAHEVINEVINEVVNRQTLITNVMRETPSITKAQLTEQLGVSKATIDREIDAMKQGCKIRRVGSNKSGHWEVIE